MVSNEEKHDDIATIFNEVVSNFEYLKTVEMNDEDKKSFTTLNEHMGDVAKQLGQHFDSIPTEIQILVFSYLSPKEALAAMQVSREWKNYVDDPSVWKRRVISNPDIVKYLEGVDLDQETDWKELYKRYSTFETNLDLLENLFKNKLNREKFRSGHYFNPAPWGMTPYMSEETESEVRSLIAQYTSLLQEIQKDDPTGIKHMKYLIGEEIVDNAKTINFSDKQITALMWGRGLSEVLKTADPCVKGKDKSGRHFFAINFLWGDKNLGCLFYQTEPEGSTWQSNNIGSIPTSEHIFSSSILKNGEPCGKYSLFKELFRVGEAEILNHHIVFKKGRHE